MTCLMSGFDARPGHFAHPKPGRAPPPWWDPPPLTPKGGWRERTPVVAPEAASSSAAKRPPPAAKKEMTSADLPLKPPKDQQYLGGFRAYKCSEVSSHGSKWKADLLKKETEARGEQTLSSKGILKNDITYAHANTPAVCVMRTMSLPVVPPLQNQEATAKYIKHVIKRNQKEDARMQRDFAANKKATEGKADIDGGQAGGSSEMLPRHQRLSVGKPAMCRPMSLTQKDLAEMMNAEDSHFTSEYRSNGWWKVHPNRQELKEHVRPYDSWTTFRDNAAVVNKYSRYPINTY